MPAIEQKFKALALPASIIVLVLVTWACALPVTPEPDETSAYETAVDGMYDLMLDLDLPEHFNAGNDQEVVRQGDEFDVNQYFNVLTSLSMEPGYTLDYVYDAYGGNGSPVLYAREAGMERYATFTEFEKTFAGMGNEAEWAFLQQGYLAHVIPADTEEGYFQMAVLYLLGDQFYLQWHANYDDDIVVCDQGHLEKALAEYVEWIAEHDPDDEKDILRGVKNLSLEPEVTLREGVAEVSLVYFTKWGGVFRVTYEISREGPHNIVEVKQENLYEYECGIMF